MRRLKRAVERPVRGLMAKEAAIERAANKVVATAIKRERGAATLAERRLHLQCVGSHALSFDAHVFGHSKEHMCLVLCNKLTQRSTVQETDSLVFVAVLDRVVVVLNSVVVVPIGG